ncbi:MAG TPA: hypothetical protein PKN86_02465 [Candidatus Obscuribacter sp.]|nr:hypothetical protein [Candidatus Obscuribacter sp.]
MLWPIGSLPYAVVIELCDEIAIFLTAVSNTGNFIKAVQNVL